MVSKIRFACKCLAFVAFVSRTIADPISAPPPEVGIEGCLQKDSISCLQLQAYRTVKSFFGQDKIDIFGGLALVKNPEPKARALEENTIDTEIAETKDVEKRETMLEDFAYQRIANFLHERSLHWNLSPFVTQVSETARSVAENLPADVKTKLNDFIEEGRGKKKKILKALGPLLVGLKMKLAAFAALTYLFIALIAKKALLASVISLAISGFIGLKKLLSHQPHHEVVEHHPHGWSGSGYSSGGWDSGYGGGHDIHGSYSNNVAQTLAYGGQKATRRR